MSGGHPVPPTPIADHGLVGDLRTAALVGTDGPVDWFCPGRFDAPSIFASILDTERGGAWSLRPVDPEADGDDGSPVSGHVQQFYLPETAVLVTRFHTTDGVTEVHDLMPLLRPHDDEHRQRLVRRVVVVRGTATVRTRVAARPDYGRERPDLEVRDDGAVTIDADHAHLVLSSTHDLTVDGDDVVAEVALSEGERALFVLEVLADGEEPAACTDDDAAALVDGTTRFWRTWLSQSQYAGRWRETVHRSAITLKLLTHEPTGAVIAAPTTSLPEHLGGTRNWDYRFVWIRDAGFTLYALLRLGFTDEARDFMRWLSERLGEERDGDLGPLRVLYTIDGDVPEDEAELEHLAGYAGSQPVRVGNAAVEQLQLDIYGEIIDSVYLFNKYGPGISHDAWADLRRVLAWLTEHWQDADMGMWEIRGEPRRHTTSRLMCWVAVERMIRMARQRGLPGDLSAWAAVRDEIHDRIMSECWDEDAQTFTLAEGTDTLDAGLLLMPMVKFCSPVDPRFLSTLAAIEERLVADSLVFRYDQEQAPDGLEGEEGTFSLCSFWYVEALTRAGRLDDARVALEKMFTYANHLGLYAEQVGLTGDQLGNFPQAFTHLSLISAAINLDRSLG